MLFHPVTDMDSLFLSAGTQVEADIVDSPSIGHQACFPDVVSEEQQKAQGVHSVLTSWSSSDGELESSLCVYLLVLCVCTCTLLVPDKSCMLGNCVSCTLSKHQATTCNNTKGLQASSKQFVMC